jgi:CubicO group peptidase (beta-lactamase class C family)
MDTNPARTIPPSGSTLLRGIDTAGLTRALALAEADEPNLPREMREWLATTLADEPWPHVMGPVLDRGAPSGVVVVGGETVASWGDASRVEMVFSIAKSALAAVAGIAFDEGLLPDLDAAAEDAVDVPELAGTGITWRQLLQQTSDWRGTLFDVPWWADPQGKQAADEPLHGPGVRYAYNDLRTNLLSLALTHLTGASGAERIAPLFDAIGVADGWSWQGLDQMQTELGDGHRLPVVTGGSHWGGGLWMSSVDLARFGQVHLNGGTWEGQRLVSTAWIALMLEPCPVKPAYGFMWWRNPEAGRPIGSDGAASLGALAGPDAFFPGSGVRAFAAVGTGDQVVLCDPDRDLVVVMRWSVDPNPILAAITAAVPAVEPTAEVVA